MFDTDSVFSVLAADDSDRRVTARKALALAQTRLDNTLGGFLRGAVTIEDFQARKAACQEDFDHHVAQVSAEVGYDNPERIAQVLSDHYARTRRWQPRGAAGYAPFDEPSHPYEHGMGGGDPDYPEGPVGHCPNCNGPADRPPCPHCGYSEESGGDPAQTYGMGHAMDDPDPELGMQPYRRAQDIGKKADPGEMQDSNDGKGVLEPHQDDEDVKAPKIKSSSSHLAESGNTDLGGPEPKIDKRLWTPQNLGDPQVEDGMWPTERKDPTEPIGPPNNEHPLKEHEGHGVEHESLPSNSGDAGFDAGGPGPAPHTKTFGDGDQTTPVTHETQPE